VQIAEIIFTASSQRDNVVNAEVSFSVSFAAALALIAIALKHIFPDFWRNANSGSFAHQLC